MADRKVLVIGLDGATLDLIRPWVEAGDLPHLARLIQGGSCGVLQSTIPAVTGPAWTAAMTGCYPGKSGIYDFFYRDSDTDALRVASTRQIQVETLWQHLNRHGKRVGMLFVPMTYPVAPLNGFMVSGLVTPGYEMPGAAHPPKWLAKYSADIPLLSRYMDAALAGNGFARMQELLFRHLEEKARIAREAIVQEDWDFFMVQFQETDLASHGFWRFLDQKDSPYQDTIRRIYKAVDHQIGLLLETIDHKHCTVMVLSDHGFGPARGMINVPQILQQAGLLTLRQPKFDALMRSWLKRSRVRVKRASIQRMMDGVGRMLEGGYTHSPVAAQGWTDHWVRALVNLLPSHLWVRAMPHYFDLIDWSRTQAYAVGIQGVFVNRKGKYRSGIVPEQDYERVREDLLRIFQELKSPEGDPICPSPMRKEDLYQGSMTHLAPDVIPFPDERGYGLSYEYRRTQLLLPPVPSVSGTHRPEGIVILSGEGIERGKQLDAQNIVDVAPTLYSLMDVPPADDLDGRIMQDCFDAQETGVGP